MQPSATGSLASRSNGDASRQPTEPNERPSTMSIGGSAGGAVADGEELRAMEDRKYLGASWACRALARGSRGASGSAAGGGALQLMEPEDVIILCCVVLLVIVWEQSGLL